MSEEEECPLENQQTEVNPVRVLSLALYKRKTLDMSAEYMCERHV